MTLRYASSIETIGDGARGQRLAKFSDNMAQKSYFSAIVLGAISLGFASMASRGTEHSGGWLIFACFFGCGFFAQILVVNGIMQITPVNQMPKNRVNVSYNRSVIDYRNYHYKSIIAKINSSGVTATTIEDAIKTYSSLFNVGEIAARPFFQNQFVKSTLGLDIQNTVQTPQVDSTGKNKTTKFDPNFWDSVSENVAKNQAKLDDICSAGGCSKPVSAFDFRCFQCRGRFCADCESGKSIMCKACS